MEGLNIHVHRSGSQLVGTEVDCYLQAVRPYRDDILVSGDVIKQARKERAAKARLHAAIGKALKDGPLAEQSPSC
jgi:hypothetical protein